MPDFQPIKNSVWCVLKNAEGKFLLLKRSRSSNNGGQWNLPGGGVEPGEDPVQAGAREFHEECGVNIKGWSKFLTLHNKDRCMNFVQPDKFIEPKIYINSESSKYRWCSLKDIQDLNLHSPTKFFFKHINEKSHLEYRKRLIKGGLFTDITASLGDAIVAKATICLPTRKLHNVYIDPSYRGLGYGNKLMEYVMAMPQHPTCLTANVGKDSKMPITNLISWYSKYGFVPTDTLASTRKSGPISMKLVKESMDDKEIAL
jgi:8-oxo-dGTP pyrophosphatase MutT (NUDIX family)